MSLSDIRNRIIERVRLKPGELLDHPAQAWEHPKEQAAALSGVLRELGQVDTLKAYRSERAGGALVCIDGHLRRSLDTELEWDVDVLDLSDAEADYMLAVFDPVGTLKVADKEKLAALLEIVNSGEAAVQQMLADEATKAGLYLDKPKGEDPGAQVDKAEELRVKWGVESGQLWQLGEHRLICGDCTDRAVVDRVMQGERARLCFTSPPYADARNYELGEFDYMGLYKSFSEIAFSICDDVLVNLGLLHKEGSVFRYWDEWLNYCEENGNKLFGWYVWDQLSGMPGDYHGRLARSHEWVFHFSQKHSGANKWIETTGESLKRGVKGKRFRQKDGSLKELGSPDTIGQPYKIPDSVIRVRREMARGIHTEIHPAVFSIEFAEFGIQTWSNPSDIAYEPFCGSGTTIIACEKLGRQCRAVEISPAYVAVALERWAQMTGKTPCLSQS